MTPIRIRVDRIVDFGTVVSLVGREIETGTAVAIHVDHRPFNAFWGAWQREGFPQPVEYDADSLTLTLDVGPETIDADTASAPLNPRPPSGASGS